MNAVSIFRSFAHDGHGKLRRWLYAACAAMALACIGHAPQDSHAQPPAMPLRPVQPEAVPAPWPAQPAPAAPFMSTPVAAPPEVYYSHPGMPPTYQPAQPLPPLSYFRPLAAPKWHGLQEPAHVPIAANPYFPHGEYVERERLVHTPLYRLRVDDQLEFVYRLTRNETPGPYRIGVGDQLRVESITDPTLNRELLTVLPDGTITLRLLGQVQAARRTVEELRADLEQRYLKYYNVPGITVTPLIVNTKLEDLRAAIVARFGNGGQIREARVTPEGTIQLPVVGSVPVQGLTIDELKREIDARYSVEIEGIEVMPVLVQRAPRFVYVLGEVRTPGRYTLEAPTSVLQAVSMAGGWNVGANMYHVVVFRRDDNWQLMATRLNLWGPAYGNTPRAKDDIWLGDSDIVLVPKMKVLVLDEYIELIFTRGIYGVFPFDGLSLNMSKLSTL